jgi:hypothetical protein
MENKYAIVRTILWFFAFVVLGFFLVNPQGASARKKTHKETCIEADMLVIEHPDGSYQCCINYEHIPGCGDVSDCISCDAEGKVCIGTPETQKSRECQLKLIGALKEQNKRIPIAVEGVLKAQKGLKPIKPILPMKQPLELHPKVKKNLDISSLRLQEIKQGPKAGIFLAVFEPVGKQYAKMSVTCKSGKKITISTGTNGGWCDVRYDRNGDVMNAGCRDGDNSAVADCRMGTGGSCQSSTGSGFCDEQGGSGTTSPR